MNISEGSGIRDPHNEIVRMDVMRTDCTAAVSALHPQRSGKNIKQSGNTLHCSYVWKSLCRCPRLKIHWTASPGRSSNSKYANGDCENQPKSHHLHLLSSSSPSLIIFTFLQFVYWACPLAASHASHASHRDPGCPLVEIRPIFIIRIVRPRIFESTFWNHCAKKLDGALRKSTSFV